MKIQCGSIHWEHDGNGERTASTSTDAALIVKPISLAALETKDTTYVEGNTKNYSEILG